MTGRRIWLNSRVPSMTLVFSVSAWIRAWANGELPPLPLSATGSSPPETSARGLAGGHAAKIVLIPEADGRRPRKCAE